MQNHHAVIVFSDAPEKYEIDASITTEVSQTIVDTIGIDTIRDIISEAHRTPREGYDAKYLVLSATKITSEAQQAALKILEEPPVNVTICMVLPFGTQLLDTVLSRVEVQRLTTNEQTAVFTGWLGLSYADRIAEVEKRVKAKDSLWLQSLKTDLQIYYTNHAQASAVEMADVQLVVNNLLTRGASNKMLLEHLALSIPLTR